MRLSAMVAASVPPLMHSAPRQVLLAPNRPPPPSSGRLSEGARSYRITGAWASAPPRAGRNAQAGRMSPDGGLSNSRIARIKQPTLARRPLAWLRRFATVLRGRLFAWSEVGAARNAAVEPGPALALGEALLDPVEAAQCAAQVVDHVDERGLTRARHHRAAVLELAVVGEHDVSTASAHWGGKPSIPSISRRTM